MLPDMDLTKLSPEDRRRVAYFLEHHLINAISPLAVCLDLRAPEDQTLEAARHAKRRVVALVNDLRQLAGLHPAPARRLFPASPDETERRQLPLKLGARA